ncbi:MAG TPA: hypothetical protein VGK73_40600, partial [Polyangiaceae bacterium]
ADAEPITAFCAGDDGLAAIVARGLRRGRDERWQSAGDLADELGRWLLARGVETDICERSLRARLVQGSEGESGHEASYAHVVPSAVRRGGSFGKRLAIAAAAGTVLIALASSFQALRADDQAFAGAAPAAAPATTEVGPLRTNQGTAPSNAVSAPSSPALPPARTEPPRSGGSGPASASQKAGVARAAEPPASARRRPRNALNYDFGL